ncbi:BREX-2 system adenine-specific DNA-methyltransferase PglX [Streptomyces cellulosae]
MTVTAEGTQGAGAPLDGARLLKDLQAQARLLEDDLRERTEAEPEFRDALRAEYDKAVAAERTAAMYETWRDERVVQIAAAWVLACVFVRFSEDNGLIPDAWLSGPGDRLAEAQDRHDDFFRRNPSLNDRDWLLASFEALGKSHRTVAGLFDPAHNPLFEVLPSYEAATALLAFWRRRGADGEVVHDFTDPELNTRFLGDLYQDLSEHARKTYALLQTPVFVEEFILDLTLEPAVEEFGLTPAWKHRPSGWDGEVFPDGPGGEEVVRGLRCIDPACGSGHFLLGMFERLLAKWREAEPGTEAWVLVRRALESVHGADKNPFAVAIARFRLLVAALKACGVRELSAAPELPIRVAVADSLLHGRGAETVTEALDTLFAENQQFYYRTEDVEGYIQEVDLLGRGTYHVVAANPPYVPVEDKSERENYRKAYDTCFRNYPLSVPFTQRLFELCVRRDTNPGGIFGQITSNSFAKRDSGKLLVGEFFPKVSLKIVIDSSQAHIPGHNREGTPTVIMVGRNEFPANTHRVRIVSSLKGQVPPPVNPESGLVWSEIKRAAITPEYDSEWAASVDSPYERISRHPWDLGSSTHGLTQRLEEGGTPLKDSVSDMGYGAVTREDSAYMLGARALKRLGVESTQSRFIVEGDKVRNFGFFAPTLSIWPYDDETLRAQASDRVLKLLWPFRANLSQRVSFGKSQLDQGLKWFEYSMFFAHRYRPAGVLSYAFKVSHNHFTLHEGEFVFKQTAPIIKLADPSDDNRKHFLLGVLNSSVIGYWLRQRTQPQGGGAAAHPWSWTYEFAVKIVGRAPIPPTDPRIPLLALDLHRYGQKYSEFEATAALREGTCSRETLESVRATQEKLRQSMIAMQEELDWVAYGAYGLLTTAEVTQATLYKGSVDHTAVDVPNVALGQRAFEIVLARRVAAGEVETAWFERHGSTPITEIPAEWPDAYKKVVQARIDLIEANKDIQLIERPEYKRRWSTEPWKKREAAALRSWLLDAAEREDLWFEERDGFTVPRPLTVNQLADELRHDQDVQDVAALYAADHLGKRDASLATVLAAVIEAEHVPYLAALRYKDSGLRKRAQWEQVWEQQREEDRTGKRLDIKVPPKYTSADFLKNSYWSNRGKLDVPKERFISYPGASPEADGSLLLGWAGWNHRDQADALVGLIRSRVETGGWTKDDPRFVPLLAGLREVLPWVHQWYGEYDEEWEGNPAEEFQAALDTGRAERELSEADLVNWRPEKKKGGRQKKSE